MADEPKIALLSIKNHALAGGTLPKILTLLRWGKNPTDRGEFVVNERTVKAIAKQRAEQINDRPIIDFEHNSLKESPTYQPPPRHHAAAGLVFCSADRGLGQEDCVWTPKGEEFARNYPDLSPAVMYDEKTMEVVGLVSSGLVPAGGVIGLSFFSAINPLPGDITKKQETDMEMADMLKKLNELGDQVKSIVEQLSKMGKPESVPEAVAAMAALGTKIPTFETSLAALKTDMESGFSKRDKDALLVQAAFAGKVVSLSDEAIAKLSCDDLKTHIEKIAVTVPLQLRTALLAPKQQQEEGTLLAQFNAIKDPVERAEFYAKNQTKMFSGS